MPYHFSHHASEQALGYFNLHCQRIIEGFFQASWSTLFLLFGMKNNAYHQLRSSGLDRLPDLGILEQTLSLALM